MLGPKSIRKLESLPNHQIGEILKECYLTPSLKLKAATFMIVLYVCLW